MMGRKADARDAPCGTGRGRGAVCDALVGGAEARELTFGSWTPPRDAFNTKTLPAVFEQIKQDTKGSITWKLIAGGALLDARGTVPGVKDGLADAGLGIAPYVPNLLPATNLIFSTQVWGGDVVAATGAAVETAILHCQECLDEHKAQNALPLGGFTASAYVPMCRDNVKSLADLKGRKVRASAGGVALMEALGAVPVAMDPGSATTALQRGTIDCVHGDPQWLEGFGYMDVTKSVLMHPHGDRRAGHGALPQPQYLAQPHARREEGDGARRRRWRARCRRSTPSSWRANGCWTRRRRRASPSIRAARRSTTRSPRSRPSSGPPTSRRRRSSA